MDSLKSQIARICKSVEHYGWTSDGRGSTEDYMSAESATDAILSTLTPGTRWVAADGREMVVVPASGFDWIMSHLRSELHLHKARNPCFVSGQKAANISAMIAAASEGS